MARAEEESFDLFQDQLNRLTEGHFFILCWCSVCESHNIKYNITNCFDDLKSVGVTRTKQTAMSMIDALWALCYIDVRDERNRKNIYITSHGSKALQQLIASKRFEMKDSSFLEVMLS